MRKWFCALAVGALFLIPAIAAAQYPKPSYLATKQVKWRVHVAAVNVPGYVDSLTKDLSWNATTSTATNVDTTAAISTQDFAYLFDGAAAANGAMGPKFFFTTPNTSTTDSLVITLQGSVDGVSWFQIGSTSNALSTGGASVTASALVYQSATQANTCAKAVDLTGTTLWPLIRLIVQNASKSQSFSAAKVTMKYLSVQDGINNGNGFGFGCWKTITDIYWDIGPADSLSHTIAADDPDTTAAISLADVDWSITASSAVTQSWGKLILYGPDETFMNLDTVDDSLYVLAEFSPDGSHWTASGGGLATPASYVASSASDGIAIVPLCGDEIAATASVAGTAFGAGYVRFILKMPEAKTVGRVRLAFIYPSRSCGR